MHLYQIFREAAKKNIFFNGRVIKRGGDVKAMPLRKQKFSDGEARGGGGGNGFGWAS